MRHFAALILSFLFVLPVPAHARPRVGLELGAAIAAIDRPGGSDDRSSRYRGGPSAGFVVAFPSSRPVSFVTGLRYDRKGGRHVYDPPTLGPPEVEIGKSSASRESTEWTLDYLTLPLLARVTIPHEAASLMIEAGAEASLLLSSSVHDVSSAGELEQSVHFSEGDVGLRAGAGLSVPALGTDLVLRAGYVFGLMDVSPKSPIPETSQESLYNRAVILTLGMSF